MNQSKLNKNNIDYEIDQPNKTNSCPERCGDAEIREIKSDIFMKSFSVTFYFMIFAFLLTVFSQFIVRSPKINQILFIEMLITIVASSMYALFDLILKTPEIALSFSSYLNSKNVNILRYLGWSITTPLMLVALCLILALNLGSSVKTYVLFNIVILDWLMLFFGLLGETGFISLFLAMFFGFISFFIMFWIIYKNFIFGKKNESNQFIYWLYFGLWLGYGIIYGIDPVWKTIITNILDCIAKAFFAIWFVISNLLV